MLAIITETFKQRLTIKNKCVAYTKREVLIIVGDDCIILVGGDCNTCYNTQLQ